MIFRLAVLVALESIVALPAVAGDLPDPKLTPGECRPLTLTQVCATKWGKDERAVTAKMKEQVYTSYGVPASARHLPNGKSAYEVDHLCSRELGGADTVPNLWPQEYTGTWNAHMKDRVENRLHVEACAGRITLQQAQQEITHDWRVPYCRYFPGPPCSAQ